MIDNLNSNFQGIPSDIYLGNKFYISAEFWYSLKLPSDPNWHVTKQSLTQKAPPNATHNINSPNISSPKSSLFRRLSLSGPLENFLPANFNNPSNEPIFPTSLPWGPTCDPLKSLELLASFPQSEYSVDLELNPSIASHLHLFPIFSSVKDEWVLLTKFLKEIINSLPELDSNIMFHMDQDHENEVDDHILDRKNGFNALNFEDLSIYTNFTLLKLFGENNQLNNEIFNKKNSAEEVFSAHYLGSNLFSSSGVPHKSFLWTLIETNLLITSSFEDTKRTDFYTLLKSTWLEVLKIIRNYWENHQIIPNINTSSENSKFEVDLRFNLLNQKLAMLNYCSTRMKEQNSFLKEEKRYLNGEKDSNPTSSLPNLKYHNKRDTSSFRESFKKSQLSRNSVSPTSYQDWYNEENHSFKGSNEGNLLPCSHSSKSSDKVNWDNLQGSPELLSPPGSYPVSISLFYISSLLTSSLSLENQWTLPI